MPVEIWRHGPPPLPLSRTGAFAKQLEDSGWDGLAIVEDSGIVADVYVALTLAAAATVNLRLGTGTASPSRHPLLHANAIASLNGIAAGRILCSFGRGDIALRLLGRQRLSLDEFALYVERIRDYLRREDVYVGGASGNIRGLFDFDPSLDLPLTPIDIAATGPRMTALAATRADSITLSVGADVGRVRRGIELARSARETSGLDPDSLSVGCFITGAVVTDGQWAEARDIIRPVVRVMSRHLQGHGDDIGASFESSNVADDIVDTFGVVAEPAEFAERLAELASLGVQRIVVTTRAPTTDPLELNSDRIGEHVLPLLADLG